jgi:hypothetical protein
VTTETIKAQWNYFGATATTVAGVLGTVATDFARGDLTGTQRAEAALDRSTSSVLAMCRSWLRRWLEEQARPLVIPSLRTVAEIGAALEIAQGDMSDGDKTWPMIDHLKAEWDRLIKAIDSDQFIPPEVPSDYREPETAAAGVTFTYFRRG